jgi:hypothetical protein
VTHKCRSGTAQQEKHQGPSTLLVLVLVFARLLFVGRLVWLLLVLVNLVHTTSVARQANPFDVPTTSGASRSSGSCRAYCLSRDLPYRPHYSRA